jgi:hypothetical protein
MLSLAPNANAIVTDGDWSDWFSYSGDVNHNNWREDLVTLNSVSTRTLADEEGPTPGAGGQLYDIEQIFYRFDDADPNNDSSGGRLNIGLVTGFPPEGVVSDSLYAGDFFVDIGGTGGYDIAVATSTRASDLGRYGNLWFNSGVPTNWIETDVVYPQFNTSNPYRIDEAASPGALDLTALWNADVAWGGMGPHNFLEISFDIDPGLEELISGEFGAIGLHWTMECGNDVINVTDNEPFAPVPEPSTMVLLGMGALGAILRKKFVA